VRVLGAFYTKECFRFQDGIGKGTFTGWANHGPGEQGAEGAESLGRLGTASSNEQYPVQMH
jgi:hypothetical protein